MSVTIAQIFWIAFVVGFSGAVAPGPVLALTVDRVTRKGFAMGPLIISGHAVLEAGIVLLCLFGFGKLLAAETLVHVTALIGGLVLLWMGAEQMRVRSDPDAPDVQNVHKPAHSAPVAGVVTSAANPYFWLWWGTIGLGQLTNASASLGLFGVVVFFIGHSLSDFTWYSIVSGLVASGRKKFPPAIYKGISIVTGVFLLAIGFMFLTKGGKWVANAIALAMFL